MEQAGPGRCVTLSLDKGLFVWYIIVMKRDTREMLELSLIIVAAVMATPVAIFILAMLLSL